MDPYSALEDFDLPECQVQMLSLTLWQQEQQTKRPKNNKIDQGMDSK